MRVKHVRLCLFGLACAFVLGWPCQIGSCWIAHITGNTYSLASTAIVRTGMLEEEPCCAACSSVMPFTESERHGLFRIRDRKIASFDLGLNLVRTESGSAQGGQIRPFHDAGHSQADVVPIYLLKRSLLN